MLLDPGDHVLVESPTYSGSLAGLHPLGCHLHGPHGGVRVGATVRRGTDAERACVPCVRARVAVATDGDGMVPESLAQVLATWPASRPRAKVRRRGVSEKPGPRHPLTSSHGRAGRGVGPA
jgi:hypothetical protein